MHIGAEGGPPIENDKASSRCVSSLSVPPRTRRCSKILPRPAARRLSAHLYNGKKSKYCEDRYFLSPSPMRSLNIYATFDRLMKHGITIHRPHARWGAAAWPPRALARPAFDRVAAERRPKPPAEPWSSMRNTGPLLITSSAIQPPHPGTSLCPPRCFRERE